MQSVMMGTERAEGGMPLGRIVAGVATAAILAVVLLVSRRQPVQRTPAAASSPNDCISAMFGAAERGDVQAYLDCFTGPERQRLERELADQPTERFAQSLVEAVQPMKAWAAFEPSSPPDAEGRTAMVVERVYANRMERQEYRLVREGDSWRIYDLGATQAYQPDKPYGTPVFELPPEKSQ